MFGRRKKKEPTTVEVAGKALECRLCGHDLFLPGGTLRLHGAWMPTLGSSKICAKCGYVHSFVSPPQ